MGSGITKLYVTDSKYSSCKNNTNKTRKYGLFHLVSNQILKMILLIYTLQAFAEHTKHHYGNNTISQFLQSVVHVKHL